MKRPRLMETPKKSSETSSGGNAMVNSSGGQRGEPPATNNPWVRISGQVEVSVRFLSFQKL